MLVTGCGMLGLTTAAWARSLGAEQVIACDTDPARLALAGSFGATRWSLPEALADVMLGHSDGRGADVVFEMTGAPEAIEAVLPLARIGGTIVLVGSVFPSRPVPLVPEQLVRRCLTLRGVHNYRPEHLGVALDFLGSRPPFPFHTLVGEWRPLSALAGLPSVPPPSDTLRIGIRPGR